MRIDVVHAGLTHRSRVSGWNGKAYSLCEQIFEPDAFRENWVQGGLTCRDCKDAAKAGKTP